MFTATEIQIKSLQTGLRHNKYHNQRTESWGKFFASKKEANYYSELLIQKLAKNKSQRVEKIELQPKFKFPMGFSYVADFRVIYSDGHEEIIDVKGVETDVFKLKKKCFAYFYPQLILKLV